MWTQHHQIAAACGALCRRAPAEVCVRKQVGRYIAKFVTNPSDLSEVKGRLNVGYHAVQAGIAYIIPFGDKARQMTNGA